MTTSFAKESLEVSCCWYFHVDVRLLYRWSFIRVSTYGWCPCSSRGKCRNALGVFTLWMGLGESEITFHISWLVIEVCFRAKSGCERDHFFLTSIAEFLSGSQDGVLRWDTAGGWASCHHFLTRIRWHKTLDQTTGDIAPKWDSLASIINLYASACFRWR